MKPIDITQPAPAIDLTDRTARLALATDIAAEIGRGASERDQLRELPFEAFDRVRRSGLATLRVPKHLGGPGGSIPDLVEVLVILATGEPNIAHALRSHVNFVESLILSPPSFKSETFLKKVLDGAIFGGANTEQGTARPGDVTTRLTRQGDRFRLNGKKYYATGTAFSDYAGFSAIDDQGELISALLPIDREGIHILDDWDGMGQRLTASGSVDLVDVEVFDHEIGVRPLNNLVGRHTSTLRQLHLAACIAGIVRTLLSDAKLYVQKQARTTRHAAAERAVDDQFVQATIGQLAATSFAIDALVAESARAADEAARAITAESPDIEDALIRSALATANTQLVAGQLALKASSDDFYEIGGASATAKKYNFDRHWRNIRTILSHNPLNHKARVVGDYHLNGTITHLKEGRVF